MENNEAENILYNLTGLAAEYGVTRSRAHKWNSDGRLGLPDFTLNDKDGSPMWLKVPPRPEAIPPGRKVKP